MAPPASPSLLSGTPKSIGVPALWTRAAAALSVCLALSGVLLFFVWVLLEYSPSPWANDVEEWKIPRGGPESAYVQQLLMGCSLALASVAASTSELLVGSRRWRWPFFYRRLGCLEISLAGALLWCLILGSICYWFLYEEVEELRYIFWPPQESYNYYGESDDSHSPPHHGPHHGPEEEAKWVEALSSAAKQAGKVAMIPISLLGVPLSKSSALWRLVGLSHEEAVSFHRWLGILAMLLTSFHTLGHVVVSSLLGPLNRVSSHLSLWAGTWPGYEAAVGGLGGVYERLFTEEGVAGLNPWCDNKPPGSFGGLTYNPRCCGVSNLAGLLAWAAGVLIWASSVECVRRSQYLRFMQVHQLHYLFFGFTCAHWSYALFYMLPSATFYAADVVLRLHSTYTCAAATARVHGKDGGMMTLLLPVPDSAADATRIAAQGCPYLQGLSSRATLPARAAAGTGAWVEPSCAPDPWAGTTCYLRTRGLSQMSDMGGWSHPFTVAGSVALPSAGAERALLVHIAPERRWHLVEAGVPLLLFGAGSGVTPGIALIRMLASRLLPPTARVRFVVIVRTMALAEALDGYMLPCSADGTTGLPWLTCELHLTRTAEADDAEQGSRLPSPQAHRATPQHAFRGGFRLSAAGEGALKATPAPYGLVGTPGFGTAGLLAPRTGRSVVANELSTMVGAFLGFVALTWPLVGAAAEAPAAWSYYPTSISGMGALLLGWAGALAGARAALLACDAASCLCATLSATWSAPRAVAQGATIPAPHLDICSSSEAAGAGSLAVPLSSHGARPCLKGCLAAFASRAAAAAQGGAGEAEPAKEPRVLVAAGGPTILLESIKKTLRPSGLHLLELTFPM